MRIFDLARWSAGKLFVAWGIYWLGLLLAFLGPGIPTLLRITGPEGHGSVSASVTNSVLSVTMLNETATVWSRDVGLLTIALAVGLPPLILWALWLRAQPRRKPEAEHEHAG